MNALVVVAPGVSSGIRERLRVFLGFTGDAAGGNGNAWVDLHPEDEVAERVREAGPGRFDVVVAVGGDGTVSSVAHALVGGEVPLGIIPAGTGNLVARELGLPLDVEGAARWLARGDWRPRRIDAMRIGGRTYLLNAGVGVNAEVIDRTSRLGKSLFGRSAYVGTAVWKVLQARPQRLEIAADGEARAFEATDVLISNCGLLARALHPNGPEILVDDGKMDVSVVCMKTPLEYPWYYVLRRLFPRHVNRIIHEFPARERITVRSAKPLSVQADGDIVGVTPVVIDILPQALAVAVP